MIHTTLPDLPPRPETNANVEFRRRFYARWGKENAVICGQSTWAEYATMTQTLSIKMAWRGRERYRLKHREISVDDENYLILNEGSSYGSVLKAPRPAWTFSVFMRPGIQREVHAARQTTIEPALELADSQCAVAFDPEVEFRARLDAEAIANLFGDSDLALVGDGGEHTDKNSE